MGDEKPLCIDLYCGLGGWAEGFLAEGYNVIGFDNGHTAPYEFGARYPGQLVIQDVLTLHGSQFKNAACIVASPPCQQYSWLAMPWSRSKSDHSKAAKALRKKWETEGPDNRLFEACFRLQREACEAAGRYIPLIVENVRGAQEWVGAALHGLTRWMGAADGERWRMGRSAWNHGSFHLWGDVPALMPVNLKMPKGFGGGWFHNAETGGMNPSRNRREFLEGQKTQGSSWFRERNGIPQPGIRHEDRGGVKVESLDGGRRTDVGKGARFTYRACGVEAEGTKIGGDWFSDPNSTCRKHGSRSNARRMASAMIAKIPLPLSQHIASVYRPR